MRKLIVVVVVLALAGCSLYSDDDTEPTVDAAPLACESTADRNTSCRTICSADIELCTGADWLACLDECRAGVADIAWCPGGDSAGR
jgi:hypothetical protein